MLSCDKCGKEITGITLCIGEKSYHQECSPKFEKKWLEEMEKTINEISNDSLEDPYMWEQHDWEELNIEDKIEYLFSEIKKLRQKQKGGI